MRNQKATTSAILLGIGALLIAVCFWLPWITASGTDLSGTEVRADGSGWDIVREGLTSDKGEWYLWLVPIAAILGLVWAIFVGARGQAGPIPAILGCGIALLALIGAGIFLFKWFSDDTLELARSLVSAMGGSLNLGYGLWGSIVTIVLMFAGGLLAFVGAEPGYAPISYPSPASVMPYPPPTPSPAPYLPTAPAPPPSPGPTAAPRPVATDVIGVPAQATAWLVARSGSRSGQSYGLKAGDNTLGRDARRADIVVDDTTVSGEHARIKFEGGQFYLYDLASTNGTFVNHRRVQRQMLMDGDNVRVGNAELVFKKA